MSEEGPAMYKHVAVDWVSRNLDIDLERFKELFNYAISDEGPGMYKHVAVDWVSKNINNL